MDGHDVRDLEPELFDDAAETSTRFRRPPGLRQVGIEEVGLDEDSLPGKIGDEHPFRVLQGVDVEELQNPLPVGHDVR